MRTITILFLAVVTATGLWGEISTEASCEISYLVTEFQRRVGGLDTSDDYRQQVAELTKSALEMKPVIKMPQYLVFVDRNPDVQIGSLTFVDPINPEVVVIGSGKISTGNPLRRGYFITPLGFYENSPEHMSYRALGTKNSKGWRGLGAKNSRVWDFGWVETIYPDPNTKKLAPYLIRLLLHATDPDFGEPRLGRVDSKGCIRISAKLNHFLDYFGILDAEYEVSDQARYVLLKDRLPAKFAGKYLLVVDSRK